ncbi:MAG: hypothetical protein AB1758_09055 [Candidatus Eremiobacterota bacterium]
MIRLVDRLNGEVLGEIPARDMEVLHGALIEEDDTDADYYLNPETLDRLQESGMSEEGMNILRTALTERDEVDVGWEPVVQNPVARVTGQVMSEQDQPLGGLLVDLADTREEVEDALSWSFTRPDGSFEISLDEQDLEAARNQSLVLTLSALGDDWLSEAPVDFESGTEVQVGVLKVPVFTGRVISDDEKRPLAGIALQVTMLADEGALEWFGTWVTSKADGSFCFPFRRPDESVPVRQTMLLELLGPGGEPLCELEKENPMDLPSDLGEIECPDPEYLEDEDEEAPEEAAEGEEPQDEEETVPVDAVFPGIPQNPLE